MPFQSLQEKRIKRKLGKEVQEIEQERLQSGKEARRRASEEQPLLWDLWVEKGV